MTNYSKLLERLQTLIGDDANDDNIYRQASEAIGQLLKQHMLGQHKMDQAELLSQEEPSDHEAEGAMRYVMSRGR